jgi:type IX secretion system PorP/SprF family membrane protein
MIKFLFFIIVFLPSVSQAQQDPYFVTDGLGALWNNPASFGAKNKVAVNTVGRLQWVGLDDPSKLLMTNADFSISLNQKGESSTANKIGFGINFIGLEFAGFKEQIFQLPINYQFKIKETYLSVGLSAGFRRLDFTGVFWIPPQTQEDSLIPVHAQTAFHLDAGIYWYNDKFNIGLSSTQLTAPRYEAISFQSVRHYYLQGGYRFSLFDHYFYPQVQLKTDGAILAFWSMNYFQFKDDVFSVGAGFGGGHVLFAVSGKYKIARLAYNMGINKSPLSSFSTFSHELRLTFAWK